MVSSTCAMASDLITAELNERLQHTHGLPAVDGLGSECDALAQALGLARNEQGSRGVQKNDISERPLVSLQNGADMGGVLRRVAANQVLKSRLGQSGIARRDPEGRNPAGVENCNMADAGRGQLIEPIGAMHDPGPFRSQQAKYVGDGLDPVFTEHAHQLIFGARRIGEGTEQIEDGADAELAPHLCYVTNRGMMNRREHEAETALLDAARDSLWPALDI